MHLSLTYASVSLAAQAHNCARLAHCKPFGCMHACMHMGMQTMQTYCPSTAAETTRRPVSLPGIPGRAVQATPSDMLWLQRVMQLQLWPALLDATLSNFLRNDLAWALQRFLQRAKGTFSIAAACELDSGTVLLAARQQPMSLSVYPEQRCARTLARADFLNIPHGASAARWQVPGRLSEECCC